MDVIEQSIWINFGVTNLTGRFFPPLARQIAAGLEEVDAMAWHAASARAETFLAKLDVHLVSTKPKNAENG